MSERRQGSGGRALLARVPALLVAALVLGAVSTSWAAAWTTPARGVEAEGPPAAYVGAGGATLLLLPDGTTRVLTSYPADVGDGLSVVALDPSGTTLATTRLEGDRRELILVSLADGSVQAVPSSRERNCLSPTFHPDGVHLLSVCDPNQDPLTRTLELFHREQGHLGTLVQGGMSGLQYVLAGTAVSPDGAWAIVREALGDYAVRHWRLDLVTGQVGPLAVPDPAYATYLETFLPDGRILATRCEQCGALGVSGPASLQADIVTLWPDGALDTVLHTTSVPVYRPALAPGGEVLLYATVAADGLQLWRLSRSTGRLDLVGSGGGAVYPQPSTLAGAGQP